MTPKNPGADAPSPTPRETLALLREQLANGEASDGYHTHRELYEYRMLYNAHAARGWMAAGYSVVKSRKHSDGEPSFGGGWFIVVATLPTGQVSNHYRDEHWNLFNCPDVELPPPYDGHTPADAAERLTAALLAPVSTVPSREALALKLEGIRCRMMVLSDEYWHTLFEVYPSQTEAYGFKVESWQQARDAYNELGELAAALLASEPAPRSDLREKGAQVEKLLRNILHASEGWDGSEAKDLRDLSLQAIARMARKALATPDAAPTQEERP